MAIDSKVRTFVLPDKQIQRVQIVPLHSWDDLNFFIPEYSDECFDGLCELYENYIIKKYASLLGKIVMFHVPDDLVLPRSFNRDNIFDRTVIVSDDFRKNIRYRRGKIVFLNRDTQKVYEQLLAGKQLRVIEGKRKYLLFMPVSSSIGLLSKSRKICRLKVNSNFFIFDCPDVRNCYDQVGMSIGLCLKDGKIINPPAFSREALLVGMDGKVSIRKIDLEDIDIRIDSHIFRHGMNARYYARPAYRKTPSGGRDLVIVQDRIIAINDEGGSDIPSGGFVLKIDKAVKIDDLKVRYHGLEQYRFALQVSNSVIRDGEITRGFISPFFDIRRPWKISYPPSMYPLDFNRARAPRIVLGADSSGRPYILWFEGAGKFGHVPGEESAGVSLKEEAEICEKLGLHDAINLDGGGSAQLLIDNKKALKISDRDPDDHSEMERAVGISLFI